MEFWDGFGIRWTMQTICTSLQTDNHTSISSLNFAGQVLFLTPNQQCQSTEDIALKSNCFNVCAVYAELLFLVTCLAKDCATLWLYCGMAVYWL